jgi:hypothetical protein
VLGSAVEHLCLGTRRNLKLGHLILNAAICFTP